MTRPSVGHLTLATSLFEDREPQDKDTHEQREMNPRLRSHRSAQVRRHQDVMLREIDVDITYQNDKLQSTLQLARDTNKALLHYIINSHIFRSKSFLGFFSMNFQENLLCKINIFKSSIKCTLWPF